MRRIVLPSVLTTLLFSGLIPNISKAVQIPVVTEYRVTNCRPNASGPCGRADFIGSAALLDIGAPASPREPRWSVGRFYGIHCRSGNKRDGFKDCSWEAQTHGPDQKCAFVTRDGSDWELQPSCSVPPPSWSWNGHDGADVGGECAVFGASYGSGRIYTPINTPWGDLDPSQVANSGSAHCVKADDPVIPCMLGQIAEMDHGEQWGSGGHTVVADVPVDCGSKPVIEIVNGPELVLGAGVSTQISAVMVSQGVLRVESRLTTALATPGSYSGSKILVISPN